MTWPSSLAGGIGLHAQVSLGRSGLSYSRGWSLKVHTDKVAALEVKAVQLVTGLLRVHDIVINHECSSLCVGSDALADLTVCRRQHLH